MVAETAVGAARAGEDELRLIVSRAQRGEKSAVAELYTRHVDGIRVYLTALLRDRHEAEDLTTQTFVRMIEALPGFRWGSAPFSAWLYRIARNLGVDHLRESARSRPHAEVPAPGGAHEPPAEEHALRRLGLLSLVSMLRPLPIEQQQVVILKFVGSLGNAEVARIIGRSEGAVKALQHRALDSLQRIAPARAA